MGRKTIKKAAAAGALALSLVLLSSALSCAVAADIGYNKFNSILSVTLKDFEPGGSATFIRAEYEGEKMTDVRMETVVADAEGKYATGRLTLEKNKVYRFFFLKDPQSLLPLTPSLTVSYNTPNGSGNVSDGEYTERY